MSTLRGQSENPIYIDDNSTDEEVPQSRHDQHRSRDNNQEQQQLHQVKRFLLPDLNLIPDDLEEETLPAVNQQPDLLNLIPDDLEEESLPVVNQEHDLHDHQETQQPIEGSENTESEIDLETLDKILGVSRYEEVRFSPALASSGATHQGSDLSESPNWEVLSEKEQSRQKKTKQPKEKNKNQEDFEWFIARYKRVPAKRNPPKALGKRRYRSSDEASTSKRARRC